MTVYEEEIDQNTTANNPPVDLKIKDQANPVNPKEVLEPDPDQVENSLARNASTKYENLIDKKYPTLEEAIVSLISKNIQDVINPEQVPVTEESKKHLNSIVHDVLKKVVADL